MMRFCVVLSACVSLAVIVDAGQAPRPQPSTFRGEVRVVEIDAIVRDRTNRFVAGLTKREFEVLEDDRPQEIAAVSALNLPLDRRGQPIATEAEAPSTAELLRSDDLGRVYVMVLNDSDSERVRTIAREFVDTFLGPTDLMSVMHGDRAVTQGLTNDRELLGWRSIDTAAGLVTRCPCSTIWPSISTLFADAGRPSFM